MSGRPNRLVRLRRWVLYGASVGVFAWGCDGHNLFGPGVGVGPQILELQLPPSVDSGEDLRVGVRVSGLTAVDSIAVSAQVGDFHATEVAVPSTSSSDVSEQVTFSIPAVITDTIVAVSVQAADIHGNLSRTVEGNVRAFDRAPPSVSVSFSPVVVGLGHEMEVVVRAEDNIGLASVGFRIVSAQGDTITEGSETVSGRTAERGFPYTIPEDLEVGEFAVEGFAVDLEGNRSSVQADEPLTTVFIDEEPPTVSILQPSPNAHVMVGVPLEMRFRARDNDAVQHIRIEGVALRGDPDLGTDHVVERYEPWDFDLVSPTADTTLTRFLIPIEENEDEDPIEEELAIIVTATDRQGNVGADTVRVQLTSDPPTVQIQQPTAGSGLPLGDSLLVRAHLQDSEGIVRVTYDGVAHRGDRGIGTHEMVQRFLPRTVHFSPPQTDTTLTRYLQPTGESVSEEVFIRVVAEDGLGLISRDSVSVTVGGPSVGVPDLDSGDTVAGGQTMQIRVLASDPAGIELVEVELAGVHEETLAETAFPGQDPTSLEVTFDFTVPEDLSGTLELRARARNVTGIYGHAPLIELVVVDEAEIDTTPPELRIIVEPQGAAGDPSRIEASDPVQVSVTARDNSGGTGVRKAAYTVRAVRRDNPADTLWISDAFETTEGVGSTVTRVFDPTMLQDFVDSDGEPFFDPANRPDTLDLDFFAWAEDAAVDQDGLPAPNCAAAVSSTFGQLVCETITVGDDDFVIAESQDGQRVTVAVVSGRTVLLPNGGSIADAVVHDDERLLILSNMGLNRLELFDLDPEVQDFRENTISVGSQPWGLTFDRNTQNVLYVANSGATNISQVDVLAGQEVDRISTPNSILWEVEQDGLTFNRTFFDFSDRPQFLAQDSDGWFVFSTKPTGAAPDGTIRLGEFLGPDMAVRLVTDHSLLLDVDPGEDRWAIAQVDFMRTENVPGIVAESHLPGAMNDMWQSGVHDAFEAPRLAVEDLRSQFQLEGSAHDLFLPEVSRGGWDVDAVGLSDTTFIAHSRDRSAVVVGEGSTEPTGRVFYWQAAAKSFTRVTTVADLTGNVSERVLGVASNEDGQLSVGRGLFATYFFNPLLGLEGEILIEPGGGGVALHPLHSGGPLDSPPEVSLAFVPVGSGVIEIHGTRHFELLGRAYIRDTMLGPIRATLPFPGENPPACGVAPVDFTDPGVPDDCVVVKLSGPTEAGGVLVVNVTKADVLREQ